MQLRDDNLVDISIHAPHAGGDLFLFQFGNGIHISIHAPRAGGD